MCYNDNIRGFRMRIVVQRAHENILGGYVAWIDDMPGSSHLGNTIGEAVGQLVVAKAKRLGIEIDFAPIAKKS